MTQPSALLPPFDEHTAGAPVETVRACVACGYNLYGLGDEPRCPECGLRNIPDEFRRQVWELVDSGKWFFSGPFALFRKRLPGWWWAMDRPGDLRKSLWFLAKNMSIALLITIATWGAATAIVVEVTNHYASYEINDPSRKTVFEDDQVFYVGLSPSEALQGKELNWSELYGRTQSRNWTVTPKSRVMVVPNWRALPAALLFVLWIFLVWVVPLFVGLITQLRKGLPSFAKPPLTILVAGAYESHRAIYTSLALALVLVAVTYQVVTPGATTTPSRWLYWLFELLPFFLVPLYAALGWIGPLRSDYTLQLIRFPFHAGRIIVMYALLFPLLLAWVVVQLIFLVQNDV